MTNITAEHRAAFEALTPGFTDTISTIFLVIFAANLYVEGTKTHYIDRRQ